MLLRFPSVADAVSRPEICRPPPPPPSLASSGSDSPNFCCDPPPPPQIIGKMSSAVGGGVGGGAIPLRQSVHVAAGAATAAMMKLNTAFHLTPVSLCARATDGGRTDVICKRGTPSVRLRLSIGGREYLFLPAPPPPGTSRRNHAIIYSHLQRCAKSAREGSERALSDFLSVTSRAIGA